MSLLIYESVIKMIIKARSLTMRHVSRTHRVALDWLFDRINLDSKIQIRYIDTKDQLADMLTKGSFTRDEWNHLLLLFYIMSFSVFSFSHISPINNTQNQVDKADKERETTRRRTRGCKIKPHEESDIEDC